jgi:hypothetical protein
VKHLLHSAHARRIGLLEGHSAQALAARVHKRAQGRVALVRSRCAAPSGGAAVASSAVHAVQRLTCVTMGSFHHLPLPCVPCKGPRASPCARSGGIHDLGS